MRKSWSILLVFSIAALSLFAGCGGDDGGGSNTPTEPSFEPIEIPAGLQSAASSNSYAQLALSYLQLVNSFSSYSAYFNPPSKSLIPTKMAAAEDTVTWNYEGTSVTYASWSDEEAFYFEIYITNEVYENCRFILYMEAIDGSGGTYQLFSDCGETPVYTWNWGIISGEGDDIIQVQLLSDSYATQLQVYSDGSGSMSVHYGDLETQTEYIFSWETDGSGSYTYFDDDGDVISAGTWEA